MRLSEKSSLCPYLAPKPSRALRTFLIVIHAGAGLACWLNPLPIAIRLSLFAAVLLNAAWHLRPINSENRYWPMPGDRAGRFLWLVNKLPVEPDEIVGLALKPDHTWNLTTRLGETLEAKLLGSSINTPWFVLLHFRTENNTRHRLICRDSLAPDTFRQLRVALKLVRFGPDRL